jgi:hypothetical protein
LFSEKIPHPIDEKRNFYDDVLKGMKKIQDSIEKTG